MRKLLGVSALILAVGFVTFAEEAARPKKYVAKSPGAGKVRPAEPVRKLDRAKSAAKSRGIGFIQYDSGTVNGTGNQFLFVYGNRFNTNSGVGIPTNANVTQVQWYLTQLSSTFAWVSFFGPPVGTTAPVITAFAAFSLTPGLQTVAANVQPGSDFLAGGLNVYSVGVPSGNAVGVDMGGTTNGQGFHGMLIHSTFTPTGFQMIPNVNGVFRVFGTSLPVELTGFEVTD